MKAIFLLALLVLTASPASATESMELDIRLLNKHTGKPYQGVRLIVYSIYQPMSDVTDSTGHCKLTYGFSISGSKSDWKSIYAVRRPGDTVLLKRFYIEPRSFKPEGDQHFSTTFYLRRLICKRLGRKISAGQ